MLSSLKHALIFISLSIFSFTSYAQEIEDGCTGDNLAALKVSKKIIEAIETKSLSGLLSLINPDADLVPRAKDLEGKSFDEVVPPVVAKRFLNSSSSCLPQSWRGFALGGGSIWYDGDGIFTLNGINKYEPARIEGGWAYNDKMISPLCLTMIWLTQDIYTHLYMNYLRESDITYAEAREKPGLYMGDIIPLTPVKLRKLRASANISHPIDTCLIDRPENQTSWFRNPVRYDSRGNGYEYQIMAAAPISLCEKYMSTRSIECHDVKLLHIKDAGRGSIGQISLYSFYAIVSKEGQGTYLLPLENYQTRNKAWDALEAIRGSQE